MDGRLEKTYKLVVTELAEVDHWHGTGGSLNLGGGERDELEKESA